MVNGAPVKFVFIAAILVCAANAAQAAPPRLSARAEREETKALNERQWDQVRAQNAGLAINAQFAPTDAAANIARNAPPVAAPTMPVQQANNLPRVAPGPETPAP